MFNTFRYVTEFSYIVNKEKTIVIHNAELQKLADYPQIAEEILHFVSDIAVDGTDYTVYVDVEKNKFGFVRITNRTAIH